MTINKPQTEHRPHRWESGGVLLDDLAEALRHITWAGAPDDMIHTTLHAVHTISRATRVSFHAPDRNICVPQRRSRGESASERLSFKVLAVVPSATINVDLPHHTTLEPDILNAVQSLIATLGAALVRARPSPMADHTATLAAGNALSEQITRMSSRHEVRQRVVKWIGAHFNAEQCLLFDAGPDPARFPGVRPAAHSWSRPGAERPPVPAQLLSEQNNSDHLLMTCVKIDSRPTAILAILRDTGQASWSAAERDLVSYLTAIVEQHLNRANRQCSAMHRSRNLQAVQQIAAAASGASDLSELCRLAHDAVRRLVQHDAFLIALRPPGNDVVTMAYRAEGDSVFPQRTAIPQVVSAMELGRPLVIDDVVDGAVAPDSRFGNPDKRARSIVSAPMISKGEPIGLTVAQSYEPEFYSWEIADLLQSIALSLVGTFERLMLLDQIERQTRRDIGLRSVAERLGQTLDIEELMAIASGVIFDTVTSDLVMVLVIDRQTNRVRSASYRSVNPDFEPPPAGHVMRQGSLTFSAIESANQIVEMDYDAGPYASSEKLPWHPAGPAVATPIAIDAHHAGVILLARSEAASFAPDDLSLMRQISAMLSTALQNTFAHAERLRHTNDLIELQRITSTIASQLDLQKSLDEIVQAAPRLVEADSCAVGMLDGPDLVRVAANGALAMAIPVRVPVAQLMVQDALRSTEPIVMTDLRAFPIAPGATVLPLPDTRGWLGMPLVDPDGTSVGIMSVMTDEPRVWSERDRSLLATLASSAALAIQNARHFERTRDLLTASVESLAAAVEAKDEYTQNHSRQVARYAKRIAVALELDVETIGHIELASLLHDVGKIGIPDSVLGKPGPLDGAEWAAMQLHPVIGEQILAGNPILKPLLAMVRHHHERWDGHGYPDSLRGDDIPLGASIISVAEALDTMTSQRPYRAAYGWEESLEEILACSGAQFVPSVVAALMTAVESGVFDADIRRLIPICQTRDGMTQPRSQPLDVRALRIFDAVALEIRSGTDLPTFISRIVSMLNELLEVSFVALYLVDETSDELE
ncbi:MAG: GAF domain-containing protein, partial [Chloroflexia bacterium]|nr:GAF domain-containing protein [Chloroflexia bacterium]